ncbi:MAG TPA: prepilin-type N-terminal cleavage/methylation domain-containing protein [Pyrinomonadaceae bacterium]|nr:prepilin-type N-terminal cleavage/methylation domain-containing protein [Pyrinomonadaceae bacterium]
MRVQTSSLNSNSTHHSDCGFSLLEMVIAITLLTVGLLGVASAIGYAIVASNHGRSVTNTKLLAVSMLEQMETLRDTNNLTFGQIANVGQVDNAGAVKSFTGFQPGFQQVSINPGPDGIFGTADDLIDPGLNGYGTGDEFINPSLALVGVTRKVEITNLNTKLKKIQVTVDYSVTGGTRQLLVTGYLNDNSTSSYIP